jgi:hypothetical protein
MKRTKYDFGDNGDRAVSHRVLEILLVCLWTGLVLFAVGGAVAV